jgi:integrase
VTLAKVVLIPAQPQHNIDGKRYDYYLLHPTIQPRRTGFQVRRRSELSRQIGNRFRKSDERCEAVSALQIKFTISQPVEFPGRTMPFAVRWRLNGRGYWRSFATKRGNNGADAFYSLLKVAAMNERDWSSETGLPSKWKKTSELNVAQYCRLYIQEEWRRFSPSTRKSYVEALTSFIVNCARRGVKTLTSDCRGAISSWLTPTLTNAAVGTEQYWEWSGEPLPRNIQNWLARNSPSIGDLDREVLYETDRRMRLCLDGNTLYAPTTQNRLITVAKTALSAAVKRGLIDSVPWPQRESGATAKSDFKYSDDSRDDEVPNVKQLTLVLDAMLNHQPASHLYRTLSAVCGFAGLRPGEAVVLEVEDLHLPAAGWGSIRVTRAWSGVDGDRWNTDLEAIAGPKTRRSRRTVPIPPVLVLILMNWMNRANIETGALFLTKSGTRPTQSNWSRALRRACLSAEWPNPLTPYGLRRTNASHLAQSIPIAEAAARLGHSVEILTKYYVKRVAGQVALSNEILDGLYSIDNQD